MMKMLKDERAFPIGMINATTGLIDFINTWMGTFFNLFQ